MHLRGCTFTHLAPSIRHLRVHTRAQPMDTPAIERLSITSHSSLKTESDQTSVEGAHNGRSYGQAIAQLTENRIRSDVSRRAHNGRSYGQTMAQLTENRIRSVSLAGGGGGGAHNNISYGQVMALLTENKTGSYVSQGEHTTANPMDSQWHNSMKTESDQMPVGRAGGGGGGVVVHNIRPYRQAAARLTENKIRSDVTEGTHNSNSY